MGILPGDIFYLTPDNQNIKFLYLFLLPLSIDLVVLKTSCSLKNLRAKDTIFKIPRLVRFLSSNSNIIQKEGTRRMKHDVEPFAERNGNAMRQKIRAKGVDETQKGEAYRCIEVETDALFAGSNARVSKQININIRLKDLRVAVCPTGREIEGLPFAVLSKDSAGLRS